MRELFLLVVGLVLLSCGSVFAEPNLKFEKEATRMTLERLKEKSVEIDFSSKYLSKSIDDVGTVFYNHPVVENELTISHNASGMYFDLLVSASLENAGVSSNGGNEIDYLIGWSGETFGIGIDVGVSYCDLVVLFRGPAGDIIQPHIELSKKIEVAEKHKITPAIKVEYGIPAKGNDAGSKGLHIEPSLKHDWEISKNFSISNEAVLAYDDGAYGADKALVGAYELSPSYKVTQWLAVDAFAKIISPLTSVNDGRKSEEIYGIGISISF